MLATADEKKRMSRCDISHVCIASVEILYNNKSAFKLKNVG